MSGLGIPVRRHLLDNGLRVVLSVDTSAPVVAVNLWYGVGSRNERPGRTGFAHLFEHMMFQGSAHVPKNGHFELVEKAGGSLNGSTSFDRTNYYETLPAHHLDLGLWLEADRMGWLLPAMTQEKLDNQRDVVKNEKLQSYDNRPYGDWIERVLARVFPPDHPYHHTVIGSMDDLDAATLEDVAGFFRTYYVPGNCVLTVCGDFEPDRALDSVRRYFEDIPGGDPVPDVPRRADVGPDIGATVRERIESRVPLVRVIVASRIPPYRDPEFHALDVASSVLATGRASRLYRSLVRERRLAKDVVSYAFPLMTGPSLFLSWATGVRGVDEEELTAALLGELDALGDTSDEDVARAVTLAESHWVRGVERMGQRADLLSMFTTHFDEPERINTEMDRIRAVTRDDVRACAQRLGEANRAVITYAPGEEAA